MSYRGFYINLDRSIARRKHIQTQLTRYRLENRYERVSGANGNVLALTSKRLNDGELGCFTSHYFVLRQNLKSSEYLHIIEDDAVFAQLTEPVVTMVTQSDIFADFDVIFTDMVSSLATLPELKRQFDELYSISTPEKTQFTVVPYRACTSSYIVKPSAIGRIASLFESVFAREVNRNIDIVIRDAAERGEFRVGCIFPFVTSVLIGDVPDSIARPGRDELSALAGEIARASFFVNRNIEKLWDSAQRIFPEIEPGAKLDASENGKSDPHADLIARLLNYRASGRLRAY